MEKLNNTCKRITIAVFNSGKIMITGQIIWIVLNNI